MIDSSRGWVHEPLQLGHPHHGAESFWHAFRFPGFRQGVHPIARVRWPFETTPQLWRPVVAGLLVLSCHRVAMLPHPYRSAIEELEIANSRTLITYSCTSQKLTKYAHGSL